MDTGKSKDSFRSAGKKRLEEFRLKRKGAKNAQQEEDVDRSSISASQLDSTSERGSLEKNRATEHTQKEDDKEEQFKEENPSSLTLSREQITEVLQSLSDKTDTRINDLTPETFTSAIRRMVQKRDEDKRKAIGELERQVEVTEYTLQINLHKSKQEEETLRHLAEEIQSVLRGRDEEVGTLKVENSDLSNRLSQKVDELNAVHARMQALEANTKQLNELLVEARKQEQKYVSELDSIKSRVLEQENELKDQSNGVEHLKNQLNLLEDENSRLKSSYENIQKLLEAKTEDLTQELEKKASELATVHTEMQDLDITVKDLTEQLNHLNDQLKLLNNEKLELKSSCSAYESNQKQLQADIEHLTQQLEESREKEQEALKLSGEMQTFKSRFLDQLNIISDLKDQLKLLKDENLELRSSCLAYEGKEKQLQADIEHKLQELEQDKATELAGAYSKMQTLEAHLAQQLEQAEKQKMDFMEEHILLKNQVEDMSLTLKSHLKLGEDKNLALKRILNEEALESVLERLSTLNSLDKLEQFAGKLEELTQEFTCLQTALEMLDDKVQETEVQKERSLLESGHTLVHESKCQDDGLREKLESTTSNYEKLLADREYMLEAFHIQLKALEDDLSKVTFDRDQLKTQCEATNKFVQELDDLKRKLEEATSTYQNKLSDREATLENLRNRVKELEDDLAKATLNREQECDRLRGEINSTYQKELSDRQTMIDTLKFQLKALEDGLTRASLERKQESDDLRQKLEAATSTHEKELADRDTLKTQLKAIEDDLASANSNREQLKLQMEVDKNALTRELEAATSTYKREAADHETIFQSSQSRVKELEDGLARTKQECASLKQELEAVSLTNEKEITLRGTMLQKFQSRVKELEDDLARATFDRKQECDALKRELEVATSTYQKELADHEITLNTLKTRLKALEDDLARATSDREQLHSQCERENVLRHELEAAILMYEKEIADHKTMLAQVPDSMGKIDLLTLELNTEKQMKEVAVNRLESLQSRIQGTLSKVQMVEDLSNEFIQADAIGQLDMCIQKLLELQQVENANMQLQAQLEQVNEEAARLRSDRDYLQAELSESEQRLSTVREKLKLAIKKGKSVEQQRDEVKQLLTQKSAEYESTIQEKTSEINRLVKKLESSESEKISQVNGLTTELEEKTSQVIVLTKEVNGLTKKLEERGNLIKRYELTIQERNSEVNRLTRKLEGCEVYIQQQTSEASRLTTEVNELTREVNEMTRKLEELEIEKSSELRRLTQQKNSEVEKLTAEIESLSTEVDRLTSEVESLTRQRSLEVGRLTKKLEGYELTSQELRSLRQKVGNILEEKHLLEESKAEAYAHLQKASEENDLLQGQLRSRSEEIDLLQSQLGSRSEEVDSLRGQLRSKSDVIQGQLRSLEEQNKDFQQEFSELESVAKQLLQIISGNEMKMVSVKGNNESEHTGLFQKALFINRLLDESLAEFKQRIEHLTVLKRKTEALELNENLLLGQLASKNREIEEKTQEEVRLYARVEELEDIIEQNHVTMENMESARNKAMGKFTFTLNKFQELQKQCEAMLVEIEGLQTSLDGCHVEISGLNSKIESLQKDLHEKDTNLTILEGKLKLLGAKVTQEQAPTKADEILDSLEARIQNLQHENENFQYVFQRKEAELLNLRRKMDGAVAENQRLTNLRSASTSEIEELEEPKHVNVVNAPHIRSQRKTSTPDQVVIEMDAQTFALEEKGNAFKPLQLLSFLPKAGHRISDRVDSLSVSAIRVLMRQPIARLSLMVYWIAVHLWIAFTLSMARI